MSHTTPLTLNRLGPCLHELPVNVIKTITDMLNDSLNSEEIKILKDSEKNKGINGPIGVDFKPQKSLEDHDIKKIQSVIDEVRALMASGVISDIDTLASVILSRMMED